MIEFLYSILAQSKDNNGAIHNIDIWCNRVLLDTSNVKNIYEHIEAQSIKTTLLKLFKKYNFITEQDMLNENVKIYYHKKNNRSNGKAYLKLIKQESLLCEF